MANVKVTELSALLSADAADADVVMIVNVDADTSNKMLVSELRSLITNALVIGVDVQAYSAILGATTASYTTALDTKLDGIEANADVTDADNVNSSGAVMESDYTPAFSLLVQQSGTGSPESLSIATGTIVGRITGGGSEIDDLSPTQVRLLLNVEDGADVTDTTNVTNAGALMDSEVTNLDEVKAFDSTDYAAALGADDNYVTDAEKIVIGNTSGTNTGDQDISGKQDILSEGAFVDGDKTKLDGIETGADVTDATNVAATGAVIPTGTPDGTKFLRDDEVWTTIPGGGDALTSNPLSQFAETTSLQLLGIISDETGTGALVFGTSPTLVTPNLGTPSVLVGTNITGTASGLTVGATTGVEAGADVTDTDNVTAAGALMDSEVTNLAQVKAFDSADYAEALGADDNYVTDAEKIVIGNTSGTNTGDQDISGKQDILSEGAFVDGDKTKLDGVETGADVTDTDNVTAAGALMDSEVTNLAQVKAFDSTDYATSTQGTTADNALPKTGGAMTGAITTNSTFDGRDIATDGAKLDGIEANADVTDTINVTNAGALMDSEVTNLAQVKAFDSADYATSTQGTTADNALPTTGGAMTGAITTTSTFDGRDIATDGTKLDTISTNADVTDSTSVTAAGALMDSELASIADVKALNQSLVSGAAPVLDATNFTNLPSGGGISIGDAISGVTNNTVLFADGSGNLLYNSKFIFNGTSLNYTGQSTASTSCTSFGLNAGNGNGYNEVVSIGNGAGQSSSGVRKTSIGYSAGKSSSGTEGTYLGNSAGESSGGNRNQYIGYRCGMNRSSGGANNGMGDYSFFAGSGTQNSALGSSSQNSSVGSYNSSVGSATMTFNSGSNNNAIGFRACNSNTGSNVLALGDLAGWGNTQSNRTIIGQSHLPQFAGAVAAASTLPAASANGVYLYWDTTDDTIKARP